MNCCTEEEDEEDDDKSPPRLSCIQQDAGAASPQSHTSLSAPQIAPNHTRSPPFLHSLREGTELFFFLF